jgi:hypothetical protein
VPASEPFPLPPLVAWNTSERLKGVTTVILDDVFSQAASDHPANDSITIEVSVTTNQTGGFKSTTNKSSAPAPVKLNYSPSVEVSKPLEHKRFPAFFSGGGITLTQPPPDLIAPGGHYTVQISGTSFVPTVDGATNIIFGAAGSAFVTISLCNYFASVTPK